MAWSGTILLGDCAEINVLLQLESTPECYIGFEGLAWSGTILLGNCAEINVLLQLESTPECYIGFEELV
ncbi:MAG: hypothetical protein WBL63_02185, partial [Candidatus Acidiferrum sp.]